MPSSYCSTSPGEISISDGEVDGTDYLLSSTIKLDDNFNFFQILGELFVSIVAFKISSYNILFKNGSSWVSGKHK
jgi:hypothetical protein